jgi:hypothetical protein
MAVEQDNHSEQQTDRRILADIYAVIAALAALRLLFPSLGHVPTEGEAITECVVAGIAYGMTVFALRFGSTFGRLIAFLPLFILTFCILMAIGNADPDLVRRFWSDRI